MEITFKWPEFKEYVIPKNLNLLCVNRYGNYYVSCSDSNGVYICVINQDGLDNQIDFDTNYKSNLVITG